MVGDELDGEAQASRAPTLDDLRKLCAALNAAGARYMVIGGLAVNYWGGQRFTQDIDLLVDPSSDNVRKVKLGLEVLPDRAAREIGDTDVQDLTVVRVMDEVTVDLMARVGDIEFANAEAVSALIDGVIVPIASLTTLIETKQGRRDKDRLDLQFLLRRKAGHERPG